MATSDFSAKVLEACEAGEKFVEAFYDIVDKRRTVSNFSSPSLMFIMLTSHTFTTFNLVP